MSRVLNHIRTKGRVNYMQLMNDLNLSRTELNIQLAPLLALNEVTEHPQDHSAYEYTLAPLKPKPTNGKQTRF